MRPTSLFRLILVGLLLGTSSNGLAQSPDESVYLLLQRLELERLQIAYLERQLATESVPTRATKMAVELAALLVKELNAANDPGKVDLAAQRLQDLIKALPDVRQPALQLAIWNSEFLQVEKLCHAAFDQPFEDVRATAQQRLNELIRSLQTAQGEWAIKPSEEVGQADELDTRDEEFSLRAQRTRDGHLAQVQFLLAWLHYYHGVLAGDSASQTVAWRASNLGFRELLQIPADQPITELDRERLGLTASPMMRIVLGLAMTEQALGNSASAEYCFSFLDDSGLDSGLQLRLPFWRLQSFVFPRQLGLAGPWLRTARHAVNKDLPLPTELVYLGERIAHSTAAHSAKSAEKDAFLAEVLSHLLELKEFDLADRMLNSRGDLLQTITDKFCKNWLASRQAFRRGELTGRADEYAEAIATATAALQNSAPQTQPEQLAQVRLLLAWSLLRSGNYDRAAREFRQVAWITRTLDPNESALAAWAGIQALVQSSVDDKNSRQVFAAIDELARMHPEAPQVAQANLERLRLQAIWQNDAQAEERLASIPPSDSRFGEAQLALIRNQHERLLAAKESGADGAALLSSMSTMVDLLSTARGSMDDRSYVKTLLLVADSALQLKPPNLEIAKQQINKAADLVNGSDLPGPVLSEVQASRFRWAKLAGDNALANEMADWLAENASSSELRLQGAIYRAEQCDRLLAANPNDRELLDQALQLYRHLSDQLGNSTADLKRSNNAFISLARLAELEMATGQTASADEHFSRLLAAAPNDLSTLQKAGRCKIQRADYSGALELWRRIVRGTSGEDWLEAKYYVILCLRHTSPESADEVLDQTLALAKDMPTGWRTRFEKLRQGSGAPQPP